MGVARRVRERARGSRQQGSARRAGALPDPSPGRVHAGPSGSRAAASTRSGERDRLGLELVRSRTRDRGRPAVEAHGQRDGARAHGRPAAMWRCRTMYSASWTAIRIPRTSWPSTSCPSTSHHSMNTAARGGITISSRLVVRLLVAIEAKAREPLGPRLFEQLEGAAGKSASKIPARVTGLCEMLFGIDPVDPRSGQIMDSALRLLRYQLLTAAAGATIEAGRHGCVQAVLLINEFAGRRADGSFDLPAGTTLDTDLPPSCRGLDGPSRSWMQRWQGRSGWRRSGSLWARRPATSSESRRASRSARPARQCVRRDVRAARSTMSAPRTTSSPFVTAARTNTGRSRPAGSVFSALLPWVSAERERQSAAGSCRGDNREACDSLGRDLARERRLITLVLALSAGTVVLARRSAYPELSGIDPVDLSAGLQPNRARSWVWRRGASAGVR